MAVGETVLVKVVLEPKVYWVHLVNPEYSLEELMLKLKLQNFGHLM